MPRPSTQNDVRTSAGGSANFYLTRVTRRWIRIPCWLVILVVTTFVEARDIPTASIPAPSARPSWFPFSLGTVTPHPAVVRITAQERQAQSQGSGTLVSVRGQHGLVITNWHVVRDAQGLILTTFPDGFQSAAAVLKVDPDWDLAALLIWRPAVKPIAISQVAPHPGDVLSIAGYGSGDYRTSSGRCTQYVAPGRQMPYEMVEVSTEARQGDSGGPILNERGELAGVLFGAGDGTTSGSYCGRVRWFLDAVWPNIDQPDDLVAVSANSLPVSSWPVEAAAPDPAQSNTEQGLFDAYPATEAPQIAIANGGLSSDSQPAITEVPVVASRWPVLNDPPVMKSPPDVNWNSVVGDTPVEQAKAILAGIGVLAVLSHFFGWGGDSKKKK